MTKLTATRWFWLLGIGCTVICLLLTHVLSSNDQYLVLGFYEDHLREALFVGLLTVAAFLFSLQTFIVVTMKENVYEADGYKRRIVELKKINPKITRYGPLNNFSLLLFLSVLISLIGAVAQFTIGIVGEPYMAAIAIALSLWSIAMIFVSLFYLQANLKSWFEFLESSDTDGAD